MKLKKTISKTANKYLKFTIIQIFKCFSYDSASQLK